MLWLQETEPSSKKLNPRGVQGELTGGKVAAPGDLGPRTLLTELCLSLDLCLSVSFLALSLSLPPSLPTSSVGFFIHTVWEQWRLINPDPHSLASEENFTTIHIITAPPERW